MPKGFPVGCMLAIIEPNKDINMYVHPKLFIKL